MYSLIWLGESLTRSFSNKPARSWSIYGKTIYTERGDSLPWPRDGRVNSSETPIKANVLTPHNEHIQNFNNAFMMQGLENLDLSKRGHGHALLLVVH